MILSSIPTTYAISCLACLCVAAVLIALRPQDFELFTHRYWRFLSRPWKLVTFAIATVVITAAAPYSGDPTWDRVDSVLISVAVFITAPWAVGAVYRAATVHKSGLRFFVAATVFFLPCWTYDAYILFRDGVYPPTWLSNLGLSGPICLLAGMFWNLDRHASESSMFTFRWAEWPPEQSGGFRSVAAVGALIAIPVVIAVAAFVVSYLS